MVLYLDFDNTIVNTSKEVIEIMNHLTGKDYKWSDLKKYNFTDLFPEMTYEDIEKIFDSEELFDKIHWIDGCREVIEWWKNKGHAVHFVTIGRKKNLDKKIEWLIMNSPVTFFFTGIMNYGDPDKSQVDMSDGIFIDDHIKYLRASNAKEKILFRNHQDGDWNGIEPNDDVYILDTWEQIKDFLGVILNEQDSIVG